MESKNIKVRALGTVYTADNRRQREGDVFFIPDVSHFSSNGMEFVDDKDGKLMEEFEAYKLDAIEKAPKAKLAAEEEAKKHDKKFPLHEKAKEKAVVKDSKDVI